MKNKVLINVYVPKLLETYNVYIPVNERVVRIKELLTNAIYDLSDSCFVKDQPHYLIDATTGNIYQDSQIIRESNIKNGMKIVLF